MVSHDVSDTSFMFYMLVRSLGFRFVSVKVGFSGSLSVGNTEFIGARFQGKPSFSLEGNLSFSSPASF